jgi:hypothetical protein
MKWDFHGPQEGTEFASVGSTSHKETISLCKTGWNPEHGKTVKRWPGISWTLVVNSLEAVCSFPFITSAINCFRRYIRSYGTVAKLSTIPHCWFPRMSHVPVAWQRPGYNIHISSDISALWAECHISPCLYSSLYLYNQVKDRNKTIPFTER